MRVMMNSLNSVRVFGLYLCWDFQSDVALDWSSSNNSIIHLKPCYWVSNRVAWKSDSWTLGTLGPLDCFYTNLWPSILDIPSSSKSLWPLDISSSTCANYLLGKIPIAASSKSAPNWDSSKMFIAAFISLLVYTRAAYTLSLLAPTKAIIWSTS